MRGYYVYIGGACSDEILGCEAAYDVYAQACEIAERLGMVVDLVDGETGEVIATNQELDS